MYQRMKIASLSAAYEFGADNRLESIAATYTNGTKTTFSFSYDSANRLNGISYPNGINSTFGLDVEGRVTGIVHGNFINRTIQRNALGFKDTELIDAGLKPTVPTTERRIKTHNDADQLVSERIQSGGGWTDAAYGYNANGCLTNILANGVETKKFGYNYDNMLTSVDSSAGSIRYLYDALGARVGRIVGSVSHYFVTDQGDALKRPLAETDAAGNIIRFYVWNGSQLLCHIEANGTVRYYHSDELGSTLALTDATGNVTDQFAYIPYGYATHTGSTQTPFQWLGGYGVYYDSDTELHLTLHRAYSSTMKRFIHPDPLGIDGGVNVYAMANLNPLFFVDPYGLSGWDWLSNGLSFVGGALQTAAGFTIATTTSWTGIGAVAGTALMVNGAISMGAAGKNMYDLAHGEEASLNSSGLAGLATSLVTDDPKANAIASGVDITVNFVAGAGGQQALKKALLSKAQSGTITRTVLNTTRSGTLTGTERLPAESIVDAATKVEFWKQAITWGGVGTTTAGSALDIYSESQRSTMYQGPGYEFRYNQYDAGKYRIK
ncbi:MAG: DUF4225 domain-containing protein [Pontiellaceae bacterium]|nr:DUF4225 domain-containing protein [Pontiellaceae bacterium]